MLPADAALPPGAGREGVWDPNARGGDPKNLCDQKSRLRPPPQHDGGSDIQHQTRKEAPDKSPELLFIDCVTTEEIAGWDKPTDFLAFPARRSDQASVPA